MKTAKPIRPGRVMRQRVRAVAKATGCTCHPDVELVRYFNDHAQHFRVLHDDDCPAADAGRALALYPKVRRSA